MTKHLDDLPPQARKHLKDIAREYGLSDNAVQGMIDEFNEQVAHGIKPKRKHYDDKNATIRLARCEIVDGCFVFNDEVAEGLKVAGAVPPQFAHGRFVARDVYLIQENGKWSVAFDPDRVTPVK